MAKPILKSVKKQKRSDLSWAIKITTIVVTLILFCVALAVSISNSYVVIFSNYEKDAWLFALALEVLALGEVAAAVANGTKKEVSKNLYDTGNIITTICFTLALSVFAITPCSFMAGRQCILWILLIASVIQMVTMIARRNKGVTTSSIVSFITLVLAGAQLVFLPLMFGARGEEYLFAIPIGIVVIPVAAKVFDKTRKERLGASVCVTAAIICMAVAVANIFCYYSAYQNLRCYDAERPDIPHARSGYYVSSDYIDKMDRFRFCRNFR
ncbi:hypothetical protein J6X13_01595 [Candidatus Saccharibacteria bacterium]|nr:hypothetical protein [Candidatus Saccharibacteria bacterium]